MVVKYPWCLNNPLLAAANCGRVAITSLGDFSPSFFIKSTITLTFIQKSAPRKKYGSKDKKQDL